MNYKPLYAGKEGPTLSITSMRPGRQKEFIIVCAELEDRTAAEALEGALLLVPRGTLPELAEEEYYYADLIGMQVRLTNTDENYGAVLGVSNFGAGDILVVKAAKGDTLYIPFRQDTVVEIRCEAGYLILDSTALEELTKPLPPTERGSHE